MIVALIACGAFKAAKACAAKDLYKGCLFKAACKAAQCLGNDWAILSAKHGLLLPSTVIEPYNITLRNMQKQERNEWAAKTKKQIQSQWPNATFICLAPHLYSAALEGLPATFPLANMGIGYQLQWLTREAKRHEADLFR